MAVVYAPESEYAKEMERWNTPRRQGGMRPDGFEAYPMMLYKAFRREDGRVMCGDNPLVYRDPQAQLEAEAFARQCQHIVKNEDEEAREKLRGWCASPQAALDAFEAEQRAIGQAAAEANYAVQRMSEKARAEHLEASHSTHAHVVDVKGWKKPGRKPKAIAPADAETDS